MTQIMLAMVELSVLIMLANLGVLAITMKLYTEILKDKNIDKRVKQLDKP